MVFAFETCSSGLELSNTACLLLASMISAATSLTLGYMHPNVVKRKYVTEVYSWVRLGCFSSGSIWLLHYAMLSFYHE
jgi:hypothetical protein